MKRSAIRLANNTLVVSLPAKWVQQNGIEKGTELDVDVKERILIVSKGPASPSEQAAVKVDISGMNVTLIWNYIGALYRAGFSEMEITFSDNEIRDIKTGEVKKTMDGLSRITNKLIGMEIIRQTKSSCTIKEITQLSVEEYHNVLNRIFLSLSTMAKDVLAAAKAKDRETLQNIHMYSEVNLNKLADYCMRILNRTGLKDFRESDSHYLTTFLLEEVGDAYAQVARMLSSDMKSEFYPETAQLFEETNSLLALSQKLFLNPKREYYISFHEQRNALKARMDQLLKSKKKSNTEVLMLLKGVLDRLMEVNNSRATTTGGF